MNDVALLIGERLKATRLDLNLSQEQLAGMVGLHRTYIGCIERGEKNISVYTAKKITDALGIKLVDLLHDL